MGIPVEAYHANLGPSARDAVHKRFVNNQINVVVATVAFGMGIGTHPEPKRKGFVPLISFVRPRQS